MLRRRAGARPARLNDLVQRRPAPRRVWAWSLDGAPPHSARRGHRRRSRRRPARTGGLARRGAPGGAARQGPLRRHHRRDRRSRHARGRAALPGPPRAGRRRDRRAGHAARARAPRPAVARQPRDRPRRRAAGTSPRCSSCSRTHGFPSGPVDGGSARAASARSCASSTGRASAADGVAGPATLARLRGPPARSILRFAWPDARPGRRPLRAARHRLPHRARLPRAGRDAGRAAGRGCVSFAGCNRAATATS